MRVLGRPDPGAALPSFPGVLEGTLPTAEPPVANARLRFVADRTPALVVLGWVAPEGGENRASPRRSGVCGASQRVAQGTGHRAQGIHFITHISSQTLH